MYIYNNDKVYRMMSYSVRILDLNSVMYLVKSIQYDELQCSIISFNYG